MAYIKLFNRGNGPALSVYGNSQVSNNRNVIVWSRQIISDQKWQVGLHRVNGAVTGRLLKSAINTAFGLNIWKGSSNTNNCDIYPLAGNVNDSLLDFLTIDASQNLYRIKLINYNLYLTASGTSDGSDARWQQLNSLSNMQVWKFDTPSSGGGGGSDNEISMAVNINQKYTQNSQGIKNTGCALCCGVDIASFKHNRNYSIADFKGYFNEGIDTNTGKPYASYDWSGPNGFTMRKETLASLNETQTIAKIRTYVNQGIPIACHAVGAGGAEHWVVAYYAPNGGSTWSTCGIMVLDSYNDQAYYDGRKVPIWQAMTDSYVTWGIDSIRIPN